MYRSHQQHNYYRGNYCRISLCTALQAISNRIPLYAYTKDSLCESAKMKLICYDKLSAPELCKELMLYSEELYIPRKNII